MIIGRKEEQRILLSAAQSEYSEFIAVYGRRRIGKTYLIRETFGYKFTFQHTGLAKGSIKEQLFSFAISLRDAGYDDCPTPKSWLEAFSLLSHYLKTHLMRKKLSFLMNFHGWIHHGQILFRHSNTSGMRGHLHEKT